MKAIKVKAKKLKNKAKIKLTKPVQKAKMKLAMEHFKEGVMHAGSKKGPVVTSRPQAIAIGLSQAKKVGKKSKKK